jgi:uncharacterized protein YprB with RNaseH-like and TPR domain
MIRAARATLMAMVLLGGRPGRPSSLTDSGRVQGDWVAIEIAPDAVKWPRTVLNLCRGLLSVIRNTFVHLPDIGPKRERTLWTRGILNWSQFLTAAENGNVSDRVCRQAVPLVRQSEEAINTGDAEFFKATLPQREMWRLYSEFADHALFIDIETTGLSAGYDEVTVIGALGGGELALFINGVNLEMFPAYVQQFPLLVSFNGSQFDVPFLRAHFPQAQLDQPHIDLRFVLASLGYTGGLKAIEKRLGLQRDPSIQDTDGFEAVRLWYRYRRGHRDALDKLILYNLTDVINLVELMEIAFERKSQAVQFPGPLLVPKPDSVRELDHTLVEELMTMIPG